MDGHVGHGSKWEKQGDLMRSEVTAGVLAVFVSEAGDLVGDGDWLVLAAAHLEGIRSSFDELVWILAGVVSRQCDFIFFSFTRRSYWWGASEVFVGLSPGRFAGVLKCFGLLSRVSGSSMLNIPESFLDGPEVWIKLLHLFLVVALEGVQIGRASCRERV